MFKLSIKFNLLTTFLSKLQVELQTKQTVITDFLNTNDICGTVVCSDLISITKVKDIVPLSCKPTCVKRQCDTNKPKRHLSRLLKAEISLKTRSDKKLYTTSSVSKCLNTRQSMF